MTKKLIEQGRIPRDESIVICITGNGYKTSEVVAQRIAQPVHLGRSLKEFDAFASPGGRVSRARGHGMTRR